MRRLLGMRSLNLMKPKEVLVDLEVQVDKNILVMAEYSWTFYIGKLRIGWLKYHWGWILNRQPGLYIQMGKLDFYFPAK